MRLTDDYEDNNSLTPTVVMAIVSVILFIAVILILVLLLNVKQKNQSLEKIPSSQESVSVIVPEESEISTGDLHPDDLDFWDKYPVEATATPEPTATPVPQEVVENDPATDGKHTKVEYADGTEEWVLISPYLTKNEYDYTKLVNQSGLMKYYENGKLISFNGIDISKNQGYVDFGKVKRAGISYVMIRAGARGYGTGQLIEDDYFQDNLQRATEAGLYVGLYFYSQAITEEEAREEASFIIENIKEYDIKYPIVFDMELIIHDTARTDSLSKTAKTNIAKAFMDTVAAAGYKTAIYGNKEWLIKEVDISKLTAYDVWLAQYEDIPDYPYRFAMWQYDTLGTIDGVNGYVNMNISFIDYAEK